MARGAGGGDTGERALDVAEGLVQTRGFNGFSYADVAQQLGVTNAALHYHFPGKADLGQALVVRYSDRFADALGSIDERMLDAPSSFDAYVDLYRSVLLGDRMCLCGMLAAEHETLPTSMREAVVAFFKENATWLGRLFERGRAEGSLRFAGGSDAAAQAVISSLEGAMLIARLQGEAAVFDAAVEHLRAELHP